MADRDINIRISAADVSASVLKGVEANIASVGAASDVSGTRLSALGDTLEGLGVNLEFLTAVGAGAALVEIGSSAFELAGQLENLSARTGIGVEDLQRLKYAGDQVGVGIDQVATGVNRLQRSLVEDGTPARAALDKLGLSAEALIAMNPNDMFIAMSQALAKLPDPAQRTAVAWDLLGRGATQLLPLMLKNVQDLEAGAHVMTENQVEDLHHAEAAWKGLWDNIVTGTGGAIADFGSLEGAAKQFLNALTPGSGAIIGLKQDTDNLTRSTDEQVAVMGNAAKETLGWGLAAEHTTPSLAELLHISATLTAEGRESISVNKAAEAALQRHNDQIQRAADILNGTALIAQVQTLSEEIRQAGGLASLTADQYSHLTQEMAQLEDRGATLPPRLHDLAEEWRQQTRDMADAKAMADALKTSEEQLHNALAPQPLVLVKVGAGLWEFMTAAQAARLKQDDLTEATDEARDSFKDMDDQLGDGTALGKRAAWVVGLDGALHQLAADLPQILEQDFGANGGGAQQFFSDMGRNLGKSLGASVGEGITESMGGGLAGSLVGGLASGGIGLAVSGIFSLISGLFHDDGKGTVFNFEKQFGGADQLHSQLLQLGDDGKKLWTELGNVNSGDTAKTAIADVTAALSAQHDQVQKTAAGDAAFFGLYSQFGGLDHLHQELLDLGDAGVKMWDDLSASRTSGGVGAADIIARVTAALKDAQDAAKLGLFPQFDSDMAIAQKYGLKADELGKKFAQAQVTEDSLQTGKDFDQLLKDGADVNDLLKGDGAIQHIQDIVSEALKAGVAIPDVLKQFIEPLVEAGKLTDENGAALTVDNWQKLQFATVPPDLTKAVIDTGTASAGLTVSLTGPDGLNQGLVDAARNVDSLIDSLGDMPGGSGPTGSGSRPPSFASGGFVSSPTFAMIGDAPGGEYVVPSNAIQQLIDRIERSASGRGGSPQAPAVFEIHMHNYLDGRELTESIVRVVETNNGGGAPLGPTTRLARAIRRVEA